MVKFGITEAGDPSFNHSWLNKLDDVDAAIIISKNINNLDFRRILYRHRYKIIVHATITGLGGSIVEPNVKPWEVTIQSLNEFSNFFPVDQLVLRIDPIIPTNKLLDTVFKILETSIVKRVRFSIIDNYKHLKTRGLNLPWDSFQAPNDLIQNTVNLFQHFEQKGYIIEVCGEPSNIIPSHWKTGCISKKDYQILNLPIDNNIIPMKKQRPACNCIGDKIEMIDLKHNKKRCVNGCLYCYWR